MCLYKPLIPSLVLLIFPIHLLFSQITLEGYLATPGMDPEAVHDALVELIDQTDTTITYQTNSTEQGYYVIQIPATGIGDVTALKPDNFKLLQNYPNPFNPSTVISYELTRPSHIRIEIYNVLGQRLAILYDGFQSELYGSVIWDGTNDLGQGVSAGIYIYSLLIDTGTRINKKMLLLDGHSDASNVSQASINNPGDQPEGLNKSNSNQYLLRISGDDLETYEELVDLPYNMYKDIAIYRTVTDIDGNVYRTVKIGTQWWMAENLKVTHYRNGDQIPHVTDNTEWVNLSTAAYCCYDNDSNNSNEYGALYNWWVVIDSNYIAPDGWHIPTDDEWKTLASYLGGIPVAGGKLKETGFEHWNSPNTGATNETCFAGLPGGNRGYIDGLYGFMNNYGFFWSMTEHSNDEAWICKLFVESLNLGHGINYKRNGFSIRCVKNETVNNTLPTAVFTVSPVTGTTETNFAFDASGCYDNEDELSALQVRWDYYNDGTWNTAYSYIKTTKKEYSMPGTKTIKLEVMDTGGLTDTITHQITVEPFQETGTLSDIDRNVYKTVKIGNQWWTAENLRVTHYRNGDPIPYVVLDSEWKAITKGAFCYYKNRSEHAKTYGALYNWYALKDSRNIAPSGWHVATDNDWKKMERYLGMDESKLDTWAWRSTFVGGKLKETGTSHWLSPNTGATNSTGFTARPGGVRIAYDGSYSTMKEMGFYWTATAYNADIALYRLMNYSSGSIRRDIYDKNDGLSVRLVKD